MLTIAGCRSVAVKDNVPTRAASAAPPAAMAPARSAAPSVATPEAPEAPLAWGTRAPKEGILFPIVDGMCIHGEVQRLDNAVVFTYGTGHGVWTRGAETTGALVGERGLTAQPGHGLTEALGAAAITELGGRYPDQLWALIDTSSRMSSSTMLRVGGASTKEWKVLLSSADLPGGGEWNNSRRVLGQPLELSGARAFPEAVSIPTDDGSQKERYAFRVVDPSGALVPKAKVPGADLAQIALNRPYDVSVFASGEVVGLRNTPPLKLVRWSPDKAVDDLAIPSYANVLAFAAGRTRAFVQVDSHLYVYENERLVPARLDGRISEKARMAIGDDDTLYVALPEKKLLVDPPGGAPISEEALPAFGSLVTKRLGRAIWLSSSNPTALYRRKAGGQSWEPVPIPPPPFGTPLRGPLSIAGIVTVAPDDVYVNVRRVEKGWGWHEPEPYRAIYRTKRPEQVLRCQDVRYQETGKGLHPWPPAAEDGCTSPFVVLRDDPGPGKGSYPELAGRLQGKTEFGERLSFVRFDGRGTQVIGIPMTDVAQARKLATLVSQSLDYRADVVCGRPAGIRRELVFDVAKGSFADATPK